MVLPNPLSSFLECFWSTFECPVWLQFWFNPATSQFSNLDLPLIALVNSCLILIHNWISAWILIFVWVLKLDHTLLWSMPALVPGSWFFCKYLDWISSCFYPSQSQRLFFTPFFCFSVYCLYTICGVIIGVLDSVMSELNCSIIIIIETFYFSIYE